MEAVDGHGAAFSELIAATTRSAAHLETRDAYTPDDPCFLDWLAGKPVPAPAGPDWYELVPLNDYWVLDGRRFGYFACNGDFLEDGLTDDRPS